MTGKPLWMKIVQRKEPSSEITKNGPKTDMKIRFLHIIENHMGKNRAKSEKKRNIM